MGCLFGAKLSPHVDVTLIGHWREQIEMLQSHPLRLVMPNGREEKIRLHATDDIKRAAPVDIALVLTKSTQTVAAAQDAARILKPDGIAVTLQNGLGNLETLAQYMGQERVTSGVTTQGAAISEVGVLLYGGAGPTHIATRPELDVTLRDLAALFERSGIETQIVEDVTSLVWGKLAINAAINPLTAILRVPNGDLLKSPHARELMRRAAYEVAAVAAAQNISLPFEDAAARAEEVARLTSHNRSSMLQDVERGVETEIEAICGAVTRVGAEVGVSTPVNEMFTQLIRAIAEIDH